MSLNIEIFSPCCLPLSSPCIKRFVSTIIPNFGNLSSPKIRLPPDNIGVFLNTLLKWVLDIADNDLQRISALHIVASVVNRRAEGASVFGFLNLLFGLYPADLSTFLNSTLERYWFTEILDVSLPIQRRKWAIKSWTWVNALVETEFFMLKEVRYQKHYWFGNTQLR